MLVDRETNSPINFQTFFLRKREEDVAFHEAFNVFRHLNAHKKAVNAINAELALPQHYDSIFKKNKTATTTI